MIQYDGELDTVGVCVVTNSNWDDTIFFFNDLIKNLTVNCRLYIYNVGSDNNLLTYLNSLDDKVKWFYAKGENESMSFLFNHFIETVQEKYIALLSIDTIVDSNWLSELIFHHKNFVKSGCISIRSQNDNLPLENLLFNEVGIDDTLRKVWGAPMNMVTLPMFFERSIVNDFTTYADKKGQYFNPNIQNPNHLCKEFSFIADCLGYNNYYILRSSCLKLPVENQFLFPFVSRDETIKFKERINEIALTTNE